MLTTTRVREVAAEQPPCFTQSCPGWRYENVASMMQKAIRAITPSFSLTGALPTRSDCRQPLRVLALCAFLFAWFNACATESRAGEQSRTTYVQVVTPGDPALKWTAPANIPLGTALGPAQLSATAAVAGRFEYSPPAGTVLLTGKHSLAVSFHPSDPNFRTASASVFLTVDPPPDGSTFHLAWQDPGIGLHGVAFGSDVQLKTVLLVKPAGTFQQPVTFGCIAPFRYTCSFSPASIRPTVAPVQVEVTITFASGGSNAGFANPPAPQTPLRAAWQEAPAVLAVCVLFTGQYRKRRGRNKAWLVAALALPCLCFPAACGVSVADTMIQITASSLAESKSIELPVAQPQKSFWSR